MTERRALGFALVVVLALPRCSGDGSIIDNGATPGDEASVHSNGSDASESGPDGPAQGDASHHAGSVGNAGDSGDARTDAPSRPDGGSIAFALDCGPSGIVIEGHGPPRNRVNYVIVGDCYSQDDIDSGLYLQHIERMIDDPTRSPPAGRFLEAQEPYRRYRNFVNICALKTPSAESGCGTAKKDTAFDGYGNTQTRLGYVNSDKVNQAIQKLLPPEIMVDWRAVVLNDDQWWNSGGALMVWSGGHVDAALAAQHEGGHAFFHLADEYGGPCSGAQPEPKAVNVTTDLSTTGGKWSNWLNTTQTDPAPGTGMQGFFEGGQYCDQGIWRPSDQSVMNSLWKSSSYNSISLEAAVRAIYKLVEPIDSSTPSSVTTPQALEVTVIDPSVIKIEWSVDGSVVAADGGATFDATAKGLASGSHTITARAYDDTPWVRGDRTSRAAGALEQKVSWTISVP